MSQSYKHSTCMVPWAPAHTHTLSHICIYTCSSTPGHAHTNTRCRGECTVTHMQTLTQLQKLYIFLSIVSSRCVNSARSSSESLFIKETDLKVHKPLYVLSVKAISSFGFELQSNTQLGTASNVDHLYGGTFKVALHVKLCASVIPVRRLLLPVVFPPLRVDLFQQLSLQRAAFYRLAALFGNEFGGAWEAENWNSKLGDCRQRFILYFSFFYQSSVGYLTFACTKES